jgi:hypothetical protein
MEGPADEIFGCYHAKRSLSVSGSTLVSQGAWTCSAPTPFALASPPGAGDLVCGGSSNAFRLRATTPGDRSRSGAWCVLLRLQRVDKASVLARAAAEVGSVMTVIKVNRSPRLVVERPRDGTSLVRCSQPEFESGWFEGSAVPCCARHLDASIVCPLSCRVSERSEVIGVLARSTLAGELCSGVAELLEVDGVAAGPPTPDRE